MKYIGAHDGGGATYGVRVGRYPWLGVIAMSLHDFGHRSGGIKRLLSVRSLWKTSSDLFKMIQCSRDSPYIGNSHSNNKNVDQEDLEHHQNWQR